MRGIPIRVSRAQLLAISAVSAAGVAACGGSAPRHTPTPTVTTPSPRPSSIPAPSGPFAVVVTNTGGTGATYRVLLVDLSARIVATVTAQLPHVKANETLDFPPVSPAATGVYYRNGDTDIKLLTGTGDRGVIKTIAAAATDEIAFAVSPDSTRIAVADIVEHSDATNDTGKGYAEDLGDSGNYVQLWSNTGTDAGRWPLGWSGDSIIDGVRHLGGCYGGPPCGGTPNSYHVVSSTSGQRVATICETRTTVTADASENYMPEGLPVAAGTACDDSSYLPQRSTETLMAVDWRGHERDFLSASNANTGESPLSLGNCFLSPDGSRMACSSSNQALVMVTSAGKQDDLGRRYTVEGWIDDSHLLVQVDAGHLGVLDPDSGTLAQLALTDTDHTSMEGTVPSSL